MPLLLTSRRSDLSEEVAELLNRHACVGMAVSVVRDGALEFFAGHGFADLGARTPITEDTVFRVASITKTFTAIAVMQLFERGLVDLDAPAADYLRSYQLLPAGAGIGQPTLRQLLTHTSGVGEELALTDVLKPLFGEIVKSGRPVPKLADYYKPGLRVVARPGSRFVYTDHGFATIGQVVEDVSGVEFRRYVRENVFEPLGMLHSDMLRSERVRARLATGYTLGSRGARPVADYELITVGGGGAYSTPRDMARYAAALMGGGGNEHGRVLQPETLEMMFAPQYQPDPRVPGLGLAFSRFDFDGHFAVEHEGVLPGFNSQMFVAPRDRVGVMAFTNGARMAMLWLPAEAGGLLGHLLGVATAEVRRDLPQHPEVWPELCGRYRLEAGRSDARLRMMAGAGAQVFARGGRLILRVLTPIPGALAGFELHPDDSADPYVFRVDLSGFGIGTVRMVFSPDPSGTSLYPEFMPLRLRKRGGPAAAS